MFSNIKDYIISIGELISSAFDFVIGFFEDIVYVVQLTGKFVLQIPSYFAWLPAPVLTLVVAIFSVVVIYKVLGREG